MCDLRGVVFKNKSGSLVLILKLLNLKTAKRFIVNVHWLLAYLFARHFGLVEIVFYFKGVGDCCVMLISLRWLNVYLESDSFLLKKLVNTLLGRFGLFIWGGTLSRVAWRVFHFSLSVCVCISELNILVLFLI